jgi:hypothetical protein
MCSLGEARIFFVLARRASNVAQAYSSYAEHNIVQLDAARRKKDRFPQRKKKPGVSRAFHGGEARIFFVLARRASNVAQAYSSYAEHNIVQLDAARRKKDRSKKKVLATTYFPTVKTAVSSALEGLTSEFGMGSGVTPPPRSPGQNSRLGAIGLGGLSPTGFGLSFFPIAHRLSPIPKYKFIGRRGEK